MKIQVLHTVWCHISGEAAREIWIWSLLGVKGLIVGQNLDFVQHMSCYSVRFAHCAAKSGLKYKREPEEMVQVPVVLFQQCTFFKQYFFFFWGGGGEGGKAVDGKGRGRGGGGGGGG